MIAARAAGEVRTPLRAVPAWSRLYLSYNRAHRRRAAKGRKMREGFPSADAPMRTVRRILLAQLDQAIAGLKRRKSH